jgi:cytidine deaminase
MEPEALLQEARKAAEQSYSPYSHFRVGAVVVASDGTRYIGANVENAAYSSTLCAEAVAIGHAVASGARKLDTVAVVCLDGEGCYPCGHCRQKMREFGVETVIVQDPEGGVRIDQFDELLPFGFGPEHLNH